MGKRDLDDWILVPRHEPEVLKAMAARRGPDKSNKVPTTALDALVANGILLYSRYRQADELEMMAAMAGTIPTALSGSIDEIHCDSRAGWAFRVTLGEWSPDLASDVAMALESSCIALNQGHNGITVMPAPGIGIKDSVDLAPGWLDEG